MIRPTVLSGDLESLPRRIGSIWSTALGERIRSAGAVRIYLAGGRTLGLMVETVQAALTPGTLAHIFLTDERLSPKETNGASVAPILSEIPCVFYPFPTTGSPEDAMAAYSESCQSLGALPTLALLSVGEDGHVASIFPGRDHLEALEPMALFLEPASPKPPSRRVSFSPATFLTADLVALFFMGSPKRAVYSRFLEGGARFPLAALAAHERLIVVSDIGGSRSEEE